MRPADEGRRRWRLNADERCRLRSAHRTPGPVGAMAGIPNESGVPAKSVVASDSSSVDALAEEAQNRFDGFLQGAHQMTACALAAIDTCSADVPQTAHLLQLLAKQGSGREKQECMESLRSAFEKHMTEYEEEEQKYSQSLWGSSMSTQEQDLQARLEAGNQLQKLRLQKQKVGEALLWLELMSGPPAM